MLVPCPVHRFDPDKASIEQMRMHLFHIVGMFSNGNFNAPMLVHGTNLPGAATMTRLKSDIRYTIDEITNRAKIRIETSSPEREMLPQSGARGWYREPTKLLRPSSFIGSRLTKRKRFPGDFNLSVVPVFRCQLTGAGAP